MFALATAEKPNEYGKVEDVVDSIAVKVCDLNVNHYI